jgi:hypothetical protein
MSTTDLLGFLAGLSDAVRVQVRHNQDEFSFGDSSGNDIEEIDIA